MKKRFAFALLAALLTVALACPALADTGAQMLSTMKNAQWITDTSMLRIGGSDGYAVCLPDGTPLTDAIYGSMVAMGQYIQTTMIDSSELNDEGLLNLQGQVVMPFEYGDIEVKQNWGLGIVLKEATADNYDYKSWSGDSFYLIDHVDVYALAGAGKVAELPRDQYQDSRILGECINIQNRSTGVITTYDSSFNALGEVDDLYDEDLNIGYRTFRENGQYGIMDGSSNVIMPPSYAYLDSIYGDYVQVNDGEHRGLARLDGTLVVPMQFDRICTVYSTDTFAPEGCNSDGTSAYVALGYVAFEQDKKIGFADLNGNVTFEAKYAKDAMSVDGASATLTDLDGSIRLLAADGVETTLSGYDHVYALSHTNGIYYKVSNDDGDYGVIDWHGNEIFPCEYNNATTSADGKYMLLTMPDYTLALYQLSYPNSDAPAGQPIAAPAAGEPTGEEPTTEEPAAEQPAAEDSAANDNGSAMDRLKDMLGSDSEPEAGAEQPKAAPEQAPEQVPEQEAPAPDAPEQDASAQASTSAADQVRAVVALLGVDAVANQQTAIAMLNSALTTVTDSSVSAMLNTAITMLQADAAGNAESVIAILNSAIAMM